LERVKSVDMFRLIAISAVIVIHTRPFGNYFLHEHSLLLKYLFYIIINSTRFAVPFFFVISGYFWGIKIRDSYCINLVTRKMILRLSSLFLVWSIIYLFPYNQLVTMYQYGVLGPIKVLYWSFCNKISFPTKILFIGTRAHLWFLPSLIFAVLMTSVFINYKSFTALTTCSILLYIIIVSAKTYKISACGIDYTAIGHWWGLLVSPIFFVSGYYISSKIYWSPNRWLMIGVAMTCVGIIMHSMEVYILCAIYGGEPDVAYGCGTYFMGFGVAMMSLSNSNAFRIEFLSHLGTRTLGVYLIHLIFVDTLTPFSQLVVNSAWDLVS
jgi:surface polysaccharide O-acyltransferase-like enzyme